MFGSYEIQPAQIVTVPSFKIVFWTYGKMIAAATLWCLILCLPAIFLYAIVGAAALHGIR